MNEQEKFKVNAPAVDIQCLECVWSTHHGAYCNRCVKFSSKPKDVYYEGSVNCPFFKEKKVI